MRLVARPVEQWPKLAWVARIDDGSDCVHVLCGPRVEVQRDFLVEAVWAGDFAAGDFDRTDLVFGTGVRCRDGGVTFVSSGTLFDRLWYCRRSGAWLVSNSLPALLACAELTLRPDYPRYTADIQTMRCGLHDYVRSIPTDSIPVNVVYFNNLRHSGEGVKEVNKADGAPHFTTFEEYRDFLVGTAEALGANLASPARTHRVVPLASISSGYDSTASSAIARHAGCSQTVTITQSTSLWRGSDSGEAIARRLGMACRGYPRTAPDFPDEVAVWAGEGRPGVLNWAQYEYPLPVCLFFTGWHGEKVWDRVDHDHPDPFVRRDTGSLGFSELRLLRAPSSARCLSGGSGGPANSRPSRCPGRWTHGKHSEITINRLPGESSRRPAFPAVPSRSARRTRRMKPCSCGLTRARPEKVSPRTFRLAACMFPRRPWCASRGALRASTNSFPATCWPGCTWISNCGTR